YLKENNMPKNRAIWAILECAFYLVTIYLILEFVILKTETPREQSLLSTNIDEVRKEAEL
ncbi:MAG: hypothetical protein AAF383_07740, partial [Cyanobacteria bacterium P01_A01_bin.83]